MLHTGHDGPVRRAARIKPHSVRTLPGMSDHSVKVEVMGAPARWAGGLRRPPALALIPRAKAE
jgi:hypothetical protein